MKDAPSGRDGRLHDAAGRAGAVATHLDWQWNYAAGVHHWQPRKPGHGLSLVPPKSALWLDWRGKRIGSLQQWTVGGCVASCIALAALAFGGLAGSGWPGRMSSRPLLALRPRTVATSTTQAGVMPDWRLLMLKNFSSPMSEPKPASVTT